MKKLYSSAAFADPSMSLGMAMATIMAAKRYKPAPPTPEQVERLRMRDERNCWNAEVEARKAAKRKSKAAR